MKCNCPQCRQFTEAQRLPAHDTASVSAEFDLLPAGMTQSHNNLPEVCWMIEGGTFLHLEFMAHDSGCWAILSARHSGVETGRINLGTYNNRKEIEALIDTLRSGR